MIGLLKQINIKLISNSYFFLISRKERKVRELKRIKSVFGCANHWIKQNNEVEL